MVTERDQAYVTFISRCHKKQDYRAIASGFRVVRVLREITALCPFCKSCRSSFPLVGTVRRVSKPSFRWKKNFFINFFFFSQMAVTVQSTSQVCPRPANDYFTFCYVNQ